MTINTTQAIQIWKQVTDKIKVDTGVSVGGVYGR